MARERVVARFHPIAEGRLGSIQTLELIRDRIRQPSRYVGAFLVGFAGAGGLQADRRAQAAAIFHFVQRAMRYTPDPPDVADQISSPDVLLASIADTGSARGDCDDYVILLGALYRALDLPVSLEAVSVSPDRTLEHIYCRVWVSGWISADGIIPEPFGWEIPAAEITDRVSRLV